MEASKKYGVVYVISNPEINIIKIGVTTDLEKRLKNLTCASGCKLELKYTTPPILNYLQIETNVHNYFKDKRRQGEWFNLTFNEAIYYLKNNFDYSKTHPAYIYYNTSESITNIALKCNYSRAYVIKLLKNWNVYIKKEDLIFNDNIIINKELKIIPKINICQCVVIGNLPSGNPIIKKCKNCKSK